MALTLSYLGNTPIPVEIQGVTPDRVRERSLGEIARLEVYHGNQSLPLGDLFKVSGDPTDGRIDFEGDLSGVHDIGQGMSTGVIHVHGNAGRHLGGEMTGGAIIVDGSAGDWVGGEMHGGLIHVKGSAGHLIGAAYRGSAQGMTGGTILIDGDAGDEVGSALRRGLVVVGGSCGDVAGFNMIAGTILVFGTCGIRVGAGMRRGTIGLFDAQAPRLLPTFRLACRLRPGFLRLYGREMTRLGFPVEGIRLESEMLLYRGDLVGLGKGEVWVPAGS
jgi:formylmethanofuran dehydrogenase subunit C